MQARRRWLFAGASALALASGVYVASLTRSGPATADASPGTRPSALQVPSGGPAFDFAALKERAHFALRPEGGAYVARDANREVRVDGAGFSLTERPARGESAACRFETVGSVAAAGSRARAEGDPNGDVTIARDGAVERIHNGREGVEQSWSFARRPADHGDIAVRVRVSGARFAGTDESGLHFIEESSGLRVQYGRATWVDARGTRTPIALTFDRGEIALRVPASVAESSAYPAVLDPLVSAAFEIDTPAPGRGVAPYVSAVGTDGTDFLVAWSDTRASDFLGSRTLMYGARVSASGTVLDPVGLEIGLDDNEATNAGSSEPAIAFDGTNYMVVWGHRSARVTPAGAVLDPGGSVMWASTLEAADSIGFDGTNYLVACLHCGTLTRLSPGGTVLASFPFTPSSPLSEENYPHASTACSAGRCVVAYYDIRNGVTAAIEGLLVLSDWNDDAGTALAATPLYLQGLMYPPQGVQVSLAFDGANFLVAYTGFGNAAVHAVLCSVSGGGMGCGGPFQVASSGGNPAVAFDGTNYQVGWATGGLGSASGPVGPLDVARVTPGGSVLDTSPVTVDGPSTSGIALSHAPLACNPGKCLATWSSLAQGAYAARIDPTSETVLDTTPRLVSTSANAETSPTVAFDGTHYMVLWQDVRLPQAGTYATYAARVGLTGTVLDPTGIDLGTSIENEWLVFNGSSYLARLGFPNPDGGDIGSLARISTAGALLGTSAFTQRQVPACSSGQCLVGYQPPQLADGGYPPGGLYVTRIDASGTVLDPSGILIPGAAATGSALVAWNGTSYLVAWNDTGPVGAAAVCAARVSTSGSVLDASPIAINAGTNHALAAISSNGSDFLVGWESSQVSMDLYVARVSAAGVDLDPTGALLTSDANQIPSLALAFDGQSYLATWFDSTGALRGSTITPAAVVQTPGGAPIASGILASSAVAGGGNGTSLVVTSEFDPIAPYGAMRVRGRIVSSANVDAGTDAGTALDAGPDASEGGAQDAGIDSSSDSGAPAESGAPADASGTDASGTTTDASPGESDAGQPIADAASPAPDGEAPPTEDAGDDAGEDGGTSSGDSGSSCGCTAVGERGEPDALLASTLIGFAVLVRRRRSRGA